MALDLFTVDLLDGTKAYVLAAIEHATRRIRILGATAHPGGQWIVQQARNGMDIDQAGANVKFVLHDRDATFHEGFDAVSPRPACGSCAAASGCPHELDHRTVDRRMPPRASRPHPHLEPAPPPQDLGGLRASSHDHRPHMALSSAAPLKPLPAEVTDLEAFRVRRRDRVGGVIHEYKPAA